MQVSSAALTGIQADDVTRHNVRTDMDKTDAASRSPAMSVACVGTHPDAVTSPTVSWPASDRSGVAALSRGQKISGIAGSTVLVQAVFPATPVRSAVSLPSCDVSITPWAISPWTSPVSSRCSNVETRRVATPCQLYGLRERKESIVKGRISSSSVSTCPPGDVESIAPLCLHRSWPDDDDSAGLVASSRAMSPCSSGRNSGRHAPDDLTEGPKQDVPTRSSSASDVVSGSPRWLSGLSRRLSQETLQVDGSQQDDVSDNPVIVDTQAMSCSMPGTRLLKPTRWGRCLKCQRARKLDEWMQGPILVCGARFRAGKGQSKCYETAELTKEQWRSMPKDFLKRWPLSWCAVARSARPRRW